MYPRHYARLIAALSGKAAWAVARVRLGRFTRDVDGALYCTRKVPYPGPDAFDLGSLVRDNYIPNHAFVVDRDRIGRFDLSFAEDVSRAEDYALVLRLGALFRPAWVHQPGCEYRLREDGTNVNPGADRGERVDMPEAWRRAAERFAVVKERLAVLASATELTRWTSEEVARVHLDHGGSPLRHRMADAINFALKRAAPSVHRLTKRLARRW